MMLSSVTVTLPGRQQNEGDDVARNGEGQGSLAQCMPLESMVGYSLDVS